MDNDRLSGPLTFITPVYNERETLRTLAQRCRQQAEALGFPFRMIFVDDGSTDGSREILREMADNEPGVRILFLRTHMGKSAALGAGFAEVRTGLVVTLDSDLQDQPEELPKLLEAVKAGADLVSGHKAARQDSSARRLCSYMFNRAASFFAGQELHDCNCGFKVYRSELLRELVLDGDRHRLIMLLAAWKGYKVVEVPVRHEPRRYGSSKYGMLRALWGFFDLCSVVMIERFRHRPLHFFGAIGALSFAVGALIFVVLLLMRLLQETYLTNRPLFFISILLMIVGVNFFTTGMLAEFHNSRYPRDPGDCVSERLGSLGPAQSPDASGS